MRGEFALPLVYDEPMASGISSKFNLPQMVSAMTEEWVHRSVMGREKHPPKMDLTEHDKEMLLAIHRYDGLLSIDQIQRWFGYGALRNAQRRMSHLYNHKYVHRWKGMYWLDTRGAQIVAETIAKGLPFKEFRWRDEPFESKVEHDVLLNEFRHIFEQAAALHSTISLDFWYGQYECLAHFPKKTEYINAHGERKDRRVQLDGLRAYRKNPAALKATQAQEKWRKAR